jgi:putative endonuclease
VVRRDTRAVGTTAELAALSFLTGKGLHCIRRNFRCRHGEIDLVMQDGDCLVFIEVRYRSSVRFTHAGLTVDSHKQRRIIRTAALFLAGQARFARSTVRFDVIAIHGGDRDENTVEWIRDAFRPGEGSF